MAFSLELLNNTLPKASKAFRKFRYNFCNLGLFLFGFVFQTLFILPFMPAVANK